jgi:hypothetical protein
MAWSTKGGNRRNDGKTLRIPSVVLLRFVVCSFFWNSPLSHNVPLTSRVQKCLCLYDYALAAAGGGSLVRDVMKSGVGLVVPPGTPPAARHMNNDTADPAATLPRITRRPSLSTPLRFTVADIWKASMGQHRGWILGHLMTSFHFQGSIWLRGSIFRVSWTSLSSCKYSLCIVLTVNL